MKLRLDIIIISLATLLCACGSVKTTLKSSSDVHAVTRVSADSIADKLTVSQTYGDTLRGSDFVPAQVLTDSTTALDSIPYSITSESDGIQFKETFTPTYNKGRFIGDQANITAIAKPVTTTNTREVQHSAVSTTSTRDSTSHVQTSVKKAIGWSLPSWVWWVTGIALLGLAFYFVKPFLKLA
jgi:hypothetical protein